jgi:HSP20 family protein
MANRDLTPWSGRTVSPYGADPFASFRREMDQLFEDFFAPTEARTFAGVRPAARAGAGISAISPSIELHDTEKAYEVTAELPGLEQKDVAISLRDNAIVLSGEKREEHKEGDGGRRWSERTYGRFERTIGLPEEVDADKVAATFKNGVLKITLPKNPKAQDKTRKIEIKPGA